MGDVYCLICGEPWDTYGLFHGDITKEELKRFLAEDVLLAKVKRRR